MNEQRMRRRIVERIVGDDLNWIETQMAASSRSKTLRKMAADALRAGRKASPGPDRDAHFDVAASYKSLANEDEWMSGERLRSYKLRRRATNPKGPDARSIT